MDEGTSIIITEAEPVRVNCNNTFKNGIISKEQQNTEFVIITHVALKNEHLVTFVVTRFILFGRNGLQTESVKKRKRKKTQLQAEGGCMRLFFSRRTKVSWSFI